jgi:hypothetical protein
MRLSFRVLLLVLVAVLGVGRGFGQDAQREEIQTSALSLLLSEPHEALKSSSRTVLKLTVKNVSSEAVRLPGCWLGGKWYQGYELEVRDSGGDPLPTKSPNPPETADTGNCRSYTLQPGKSFSFDIDVSRDYDLNRTGRYTIQVSLRGEVERLVTEQGLTRAVRVPIGKGRSNKATARIVE